MSSFEGIEVKAISLEKLHERYIDSPNVPFGKKWLCLWWLTDTSHNEGLLKNDFSFAHTLLEHLEVRISEVKTSLIFNFHCDIFKCEILGKLVKFSEFFSLGTK